MLWPLLRGVGHSGLGREVSDHSEPVVASAVSPAAWAGPLAFDGSAFDDSVSGGSVSGCLRGRGPLERR